MAIIIKDKNGNPTHIAGLGKQGPIGKSAYQYAVEAGFTGTESEFAARMDMYSNPNLLDNWYFVDPINQRGQEKYTDAGYTIDRWHKSGNVTTTIERGFVTISVNNSVHGYENWQEKMRGYDYNGKTVTLSLLYRKDVGTGTIALYNETKNLYLSATKLPNSADWNVSYFTFAIPDNAFEKDDILTFKVYPTYIGEISDGSIDIVAAKMELGPVQTLAHQDASGNWVLNDPPPNKTLELAKCQRYFNKIVGNYVGSSSNYAANPGRQRITVTFPTTMRANPVISNIKMNAGEAPSDITTTPYSVIFASNTYFDVKSFWASSDL